MYGMWHTFLVERSSDDSSIVCLYTFLHKQTRYVCSGLVFLIFNLKMLSIHVYACACVRVRACVRVCVCIDSLGDNH